MIRNRLTRPGITLIEMMVAMALSLGIMLILTESFKMALDFVRSANSTGELISQLNGAGILLTRDLKAEHFLPEDSKPNRGVRLADQRLDLPGWTPPLGGFFKIVAPNTGVEAADAQGFNINAPATVGATGHVLHFTTVLTGGTEANNFTAIATVNVSGVPTQMPFSSRAAEIAYFLDPTPTGKTSTTGQNLYRLIRRQRLVALTDDDRSNLDLGAGSADDAISPKAPGTANTMKTVQTNRMTLPNAYPLGAHYGEDIVVSNVLSFEVLADWTGTPAPTPFSGNTDAPYNFLPSTFDTAAPSSPMRIKSLQITIRIYDPRLKQTRQNTWKFAM